MTSVFKTEAKPVSLDLRPAERDETPLSREEVLRGLRDGSIPNGPLARSFGFTAVVVMERRVVEYVAFSEVA